MFKHIHLYVIYKKRRASLLFTHLFMSIVFMCVVKKNYRSVCVVVFWWFHHKKKRKRQSSERKGDISHFAFTSIHCNRDQQKRMMIDSGHRRQITNAHKTNEPMIIAIRLCTHRTLPHHTKVYGGIYGPLNWLCIFFFIHLNFLFARYVQHKSTWLWPVIHTNRYWPGYYRSYVFVCRHFFSFSRKRCRSI
jgi:hypothetical protein